MTADFRSAASVLMNRFQFLQQAGISFKGARDLYQVLGYERVLTYRAYRARYLRDGIAKRIVEAYPKATWRGGVELFEDEDPEVSTAFEEAWGTLEDTHQIFSKLQAVDILAGLSTYAVLLIGAPGDLSEELPRNGELLYLTPFSGGGGPGGDNRSRSGAMDADCSIQTFDVDPQSTRFGDPLTYQLRRTDINSPMLQRPVHWTRILHVAEGRLDDNVYGQPTLENVYNLLDDLAKVTGGGAEAFWLRANAGLQFDVDKDMALAPTADELTALKAQTEDYRHQLTRVLRTRGVNVNQLGSDVANFGPNADAILKQIAGSKGIPQRILTGSEMGQLASGQDADNWNTAVQDRRTSYAGPLIVRKLVDRLIKYGYLPTPTQYTVGWPVVENLTEVEKAAMAGQLAAVNQTQGAAVFTDDEIREMTFGLQPLTAEQKTAAAPPAPAEAAVPEKAAPEPRTAELFRLAEDEALSKTLHLLEAAIEADDAEAVDKILGLTSAPSTVTTTFEYGMVDGELRPVGKTDVRR